MIGGNGNKEMAHTNMGSGGVAMAAAVPHVRSPTTIRLPEAEGLVAVRGQVMTDEQMETLRRQISVYATICQQLVEMHKATMAQQQAFSGLKYGHASPLDSALNSMGQKFSSRQRWTPSQTQLQILEKLFQQGNGAPSKQRIKEISVELSQYGPISETNVYNWFQNRRARTKRKQQGGTTNAESELDTDVDSQEEKRICTDRDLVNDGFASGQTQSNLQAWECAEHEQHYDAQKGMQSSQRVVAPGEFAMAINKTDADDGVSATMGLHMSGPRTSS